MQLTTTMPLWAHCFLLLCLALHHWKKKKKHVRVKHSRYRKDFFNSLSIEEQCCWYPKIPQCALIPLKLSPWQKLLHSQNNQAFITMTGFDCFSFNSFLVKFGPMFDGHTPFDKSGMIVEFEYCTGWKRKVRPADCLGLVLVWTCARGSLNVLQLIFGLTYTNLSEYLRFGIRLIVDTFRDNPLARVSIPSVEEIETFKAAFAMWHPLLNDCWAMMDGLKLYLQQSANAIIQERYYNRWMHNHYVTSIFCFCPDGTIPLAFFNVPGSVQDCQVAEFGNIYNKLEDVYLSMGGECCIDSTFGNITRNYLYKSCQDLLGSSAPTRQESILDLQKKREVTSAWQTAGWGMLALQASFPWLKD